MIQDDFIGTSEPLPWESDTPDVAGSSVCSGPNCENKVDKPGFCSEDCRHNYWGPDVRKNTKSWSLQEMQSTLKQWGKEAKINSEQMTDAMRVFYPRVQSEDDFEIVNFIAEDIDKFKKVKHVNSDDSANVFLSKHRWVGHMGEDAVAKVFPFFGRVGQVGIVAPYDFDFGKLKVEVKTQVSKTPVRVTYNTNLNANQYSRSPADLYIFCHYCEGTDFIVITGWAWRKDIPTISIFIRQGELFETGRSSRSDVYSIKLTDLNALRGLTDIES